MSSKTRTEATADAAADFIMSQTDIRIRQPPLKYDSDCAVRVSGSRTLFTTLDKLHAEKELKLTVYCKSSSSRAGIRTLTTIQTLFETAPELPQTENDLTTITDISSSDISEENDGTEWIYKMILTVRYFY